MNVHDEGDVLEIVGMCCKLLYKIDNLIEPIGNLKDYTYRLICFRYDKILFVCICNLKKWQVYTYINSKEMLQ